MAALEKTFQCLTCKQNIKLERKPDNSGWLRWNIDGTKHVDYRNGNSNSMKRQQQQPQPQTIVTSTASELIKKTETLEFKIDTMLAQITSLRSELKK